MISIGQRKENDVDEQPVILVVKISFLVSRKAKRDILNAIMRVTKTDPKASTTMTHLTGISSQQQKYQEQQQLE